MPVTCYLHFSLKTFVHFLPKYTLFSYCFQLDYAKKHKGTPSFVEIKVDLHRQNIANHKAYSYAL